MCRLFLFTSRVSLKVQRSLVKAENALQTQSREHPHGWGIAYYLTGEAEPHRTRSIASAHTDEHFQRVSEFLTSNAVVAHVRKATVGDLCIENTHPFQFGHWVFCHNGTLFKFDEQTELIRQRIHPRFLEVMEGTTDSETLFYLVLTMLEDLGIDLDTPPDRFPPGLNEKLGQLMGWLRDLCGEPEGEEREAMMNFVLTNGRLVLANRFNGGLSFSTQKRRCADFDICPIRDKVCFGPRRTGIRHTHVLIASDPTSADDIWEEIPNRGFLTVDVDYRIDIQALENISGPPAWYP
jgi:glutamine amidotransferase